MLYVEDNDDNVYMLKMRLELLGDFEVLTAENGEKGCAMAAAESAGHHPDGPRNADRRRLGSDAKARRAIRQTRDIPVIALSAHGWLASAKGARRGAVTSLRLSRSNSTG